MGEHGHRFEATVDVIPSLDSVARLQTACDVGVTIKSIITKNTRDPRIYTNY